MATRLSSYTESAGLAPPLAEAEAQRLAAELGVASGLRVYPRSIASVERSMFFLGQQGRGKYLGLVTTNSALAAKFQDQSRYVAGNGKQPGVSGRDLVLNGFIHTAHHRAQAEIYLRVKNLEPPRYSV